VAACAAGLLLSGAPGAWAEGGKPLDEVLLRPRRLTAEGRKEYELGNHPRALEAFQSAAGLRAADPKARFNLADALYKNGRFDDAEAAYRALAGDVRSPLAGPSRFNLGNTLYQKQDYRGAVSAYRDALRLAPDDLEAKRNLELALRALAEQERQKQQQDKQPQDKKPQDKQQGDKQDEQKQGQDQQKKNAQDGKQGQGSPGPQPKTEEQKEQERFQKETGMPKERAMQLLDTLQQDEKAQQKKLLAAQKAKPRKGKDW